MRKLASIMRARGFRAFAALAGVIVILWATDERWLPLIGHWLAIPATIDLHRADAIVVHGGNYTRTEYGARLFRRGLAPELWHTTYPWGQVEIVKEIEQNGVPAQAFHLLTSTSTWSDGQGIATTIRSRRVRSVLIVTDWWHSRRALCATEQQIGGYQVSIEYQPSPAPAGPSDWWRDAEIRRDVLTELVKFVYYAVRYRMNPWEC